MKNIILLFVFSCLVIGCSQPENSNNNSSTSKLLKISLKNADYSPANGHLVEVIYTNNSVDNTLNFGLTDSNGVVQSEVPIGYELRVLVYYQNELQNSSPIPVDAINLGVFNYIIPVID